VLQKPTGAPKLTNLPPLLHKNASASSMVKKKKPLTLSSLEKLRQSKETQGIKREDILDIVDSEESEDEVLQRMQAGPPKSQSP